MLQDPRMEHIEYNPVCLLAISLKNMSKSLLQFFTASSGSHNNTVLTSHFLSSLFVVKPSLRTSSTKTTLEEIELCLSLYQSENFLVVLPLLFHPKVRLCTGSFHILLSYSHLIHPPRLRGMPGGGGRGTCDCPGGTGGGGG